MPIGVDFSSPQIGRGPGWSPRHRRHHGQLAAMKFGDCNKIEAMTSEQREARANELAHTELTPETSREFIELVLGPSFSVAE